MKNYDHKKIEKKWQKEWDKSGIYKTLNNSKQKKMYVLDMFPYPSGVGLHVGHPRGYIGSDVYARMKRMEGYNVLHPMGYDAFGLPAEQYALEHKIHPKKAVEENVKTFERQLSIIGLSYDWSRKVNTTDSRYYKWTQWIFLQIYNSWFDNNKQKARKIDELVKIFEKSGNSKVNASCGDVSVFKAKEWKRFSKKEKHDILMKYRLAYEGHSEVNWCPELGTVLANDEIVDDKNGNPVSERGSYKVEKKLMRQWFMRVTAYAERLLLGLEHLDWNNHIKEIQKNWIGKSEGSEIEFSIRNYNEKIKVFTTRADTIFGATYVVLAPEHPLIKNLELRIKNLNEVNEYINSIKNKIDEDRVKNDKEKTGVELKGVKAINPANNEEIPVWIADYVLATYGTGAVMAVPAHDERDWEFAKKYGLEIKEVVIPREGEPHEGAEYRKTISVVVHRKRDNRYLMLKWNDNLSWISPSIGGIENGENVEESSTREIFEETGYKVRFVKRLGGIVESHFFAKNKNVWRFRHDYPVLCELIDEFAEPEKVDEVEQEKHVATWLSPKEALEKISHEYNKIGLIRYLSGNYSFTGRGYLINSDKFDGMSSDDARREITKFVGGKLVTKYKIRDAVFARQRYWGEPIPLRHNNDGTITDLKLKDLPLLLPKVNSYESTGTGESPLAGVKSWVKEGYETNTMPGWAGSSWYFLRYMDPENQKEFASKKSINYWKNVDMYVGGAEHATGHLLYSRFWNNFLYDMGYVSFKEPFKKMKNIGMVLATDGRKMSKRWGNVINPDDIVENYGADTLRVYEMFMGPFEQSLPWSTESIIGSRRFVEKVYRIKEKISDKKSSPDLEKILHKTIKKVNEDIKNFAFNTAISSMMILVNEMDKQIVNKNDFKMFLQILAPFAPHITEELWFDLKSKSDLDRSKSIHLSPWPKWDKNKIIDEMIKIVIQINGKVRSEIMVLADVSEEKIKDIALADKNVISWIKDKEIRRIIYIPGRVINIVI